MKSMLDSSARVLPSTANVTVIVAGVHCHKENAFAGLAEMREAFPLAAFVLSTSRREARSSGDLSCFDRILIQDDPGLMAPDKFDGGAIDINQVRTYVSAALAETKTELAIVLRPGSWLHSTKALELWQGWASLDEQEVTSDHSRIIVSQFFTINPVYDERLPFQIATRLQLGRTEDLTAFWLGPEYTFDLVAWYEAHPHARGSKPRERTFRARYTPDQWMALNYLYPGGHFPIRYHNDVTPSVLAELEEQLASRFIVVHPRDVDYHDDELEMHLANTYLNFLCYSYEEWNQLVSRRQRQKFSFFTSDSKPRTAFQRQVLIFARTRISRKFLRALGVVPKRLIRQIYD